MQKSVFVALVALALVGCRPSVPSEFADSFENVGEEIGAVRFQLGLTERSLNRQRDADRTGAVGKLWQRLNVDAEIKKSNDLVAQAEKLRNGKLREITKNKTPDQATTYRKTLVEIYDLLEDAEDGLERPQRVFGHVLALGTDRETALIVANGSLRDARTAVAAAKAAVPDAQKQFPTKREDLSARVGKLDAGVTDVQKAIDDLKKQGDLADTALAYDTAIEVGRTTRENADDVLKRVNQLPRAYSRTLVDMRADFVASVTRWSWSEFSDFSSEQTYSFVNVPLTMSQYGEILTQRDGQITGAIASQLPINQSENMPSGHDRSEFYLEDVDAKYFHKYVTIESGKATTGDWVPVPPTVFYANLDNLGMDLFYKPKGMYEDEASMVVSPPGYYLVGDPAYGRWQGEGANRTWVWLPFLMPIYSPFYGGGLFYRDWDGWKRNYYRKRPYYGREEEGTFYYGTYGYGAFGRGTYWSSMGGTSRQSPGMRGIGAAFRGGGPGGGGK